MDAMFRRGLRTTLRPRQLLRKPRQTRRLANETPKQPLPTSQSRVERFNRQLPRFLHKYTNALANAPLSHISSFLVLHELTAMIPLLGLAGYFHYTHWLPPWFAEGAWIASGVERFGKYFKRKGWIRGEEAAEAEREIGEIRKDAAWKGWMRQKGWMRTDEEVEVKDLRKIDKAWSISEGGVRLVVEFATAYAIVKMLLVPRIVFSVWATPWFARTTVMPFLRRFRKSFGRGTRKGSGGPGAGLFALPGLRCSRRPVASRNRSAALSTSFPRRLVDPTDCNMCFDDGETSTTKTYIRNGQQYHEPRRRRVSWRRRWGLGGSYYPPRYYVRPPAGRSASGARVGIAQYPRGVVPGGYARGALPGRCAPAVVPVGHGQGMAHGAYPRGVMPGGCANGRHHVHGARAIVPAGAAVVSLRSFLSSPLPPPCLLLPHTIPSPPPLARRRLYPVRLPPTAHLSQTPSSTRLGRYLSSAGTAMEAYPKPRHQYIYTPRYGQRGFHSYAGQTPNGAYPAGVMPGGYGYGVGLGYAGAGVGVGVGVGVGAVAGGYYPAVYSTIPTYPYSYGPAYSSIYNYPAYGGYYNHSLCGYTYPFANFCYPFQRTYYNTTPSYGYSTYVNPPGTTTTTTTCHVTNGHAQSPYVASPVARTTCNQTPAREDIQFESRRVATERGAYAPRRIRPADARHDDPFWCRERNGEWHLRTFYQIENECHPGRWLMDAEVGFLVFHRE